MAKTLFLFLFFFYTTLFALKPEAEFKTPGNFSASRLFSILDSVGNSGNWMNYDSLSILDPAVQKILKQNKKNITAFGLYKNDFSLFASLTKEGKNEFLRIYKIKTFDARPEDLKVHDKLYPENILHDYQGIRNNEFEHTENKNLKIKIDKNSIRFSYEKKDKMQLEYPGTFSEMTKEELRERTKEYMDFFEYEYALMLRAFVQTTEGIFNWQPWHWYMKSWYKKYFISESELMAILKSPEKPYMFTIFKARTSRNMLIEMKTDGNGSYQMNVLTLP